MTDARDPARARHYWEASGLSGLSGRIVTPLIADSACIFVVHAAHEFYAACALIHRRSEGILAMDSAGQCSPVSAAQRRARLAAVAADLLAREAVSSSGEAFHLDKLEDDVGFGQPLPDPGVQLCGRKSQQCEI